MVVGCHKPPRFVSLIVMRKVLVNLYRSGSKKSPTLDNIHTIPTHPKKVDNFDFPTYEGGYVSNGPLHISSSRVVSMNRIYFTYEIP
jgi:hypothetical protein